MALTVCSECSRHVRVGERACPFCGAHLVGFVAVQEYRLKTRVNRGQAFSLGAALTAAGFLSSCDESVAPPYGIACAPTSCLPPTAGTSAGGNAGSSNPGHAGATNGGHAGSLAMGGSATAGSSPLGGSGGDENGGAAGEAAGGAGGDGGASDLGGAGSGGAGGRG